VNRDHSRERRIDAAGAVYAGIAAGIGATLIQLVLWGVTSVDVPAVLLRDARLAAAIVRGPAVLTAPCAGMEMVWEVLLPATIVHFVLSIAYGFMLAAMLTGAGLRNPIAAIVAGACFGALLYLANMYGFTHLFPWFSVTRDWITLAAHVAFGVIAAAVYRARAVRNQRASLA
jgi:hypothetical protein